MNSRSPSGHTPQDRAVPLPRSKEVFPDPEVTVTCPATVVSEGGRRTDGNVTGKEVS